MAKQQKESKSRIVKCVVCGKNFGTTHSQGKYWNDDCSREGNRKRQKAYHLAHKKEITECKKAYRATRKKEIADWQKEYRRKYPDKSRVLCRKYRALKRSNAHEPYTDTYIFERDDWMCGICGRGINKRLKRPNLLSKSIDHIIPISKGGADAPINLQAAHLRCNQLKSAGNGGQLRLIG